MSRKCDILGKWLPLLCALLLLYGTALAGEAELKVTFSFPGEFLEAGQPIVQTENEYQSENVHIKLTGFFHEEAHTDVTVADIHIRTMDCFQRVFAQDADGHAASTLRRMNGHIEAILLMNGDNAMVGQNGIMRRQKEKNNRELCLLYESGEMRCLSIGKAKEEGLYEHPENIVLNFCFGPSLLNADGYPILKKERFSTTDVFRKNPRSVLGYYEPGHYCFVVIGGRKTDSLFAENKKNFGADLCMTSQILHELGCSQAYNLDGGQSSAMMYLGNYQNSLYNNGRAVGDALMIGEPGADHLINE